MCRPNDWTIPHVDRKNLRILPPHHVYSACKSHHGDDEIFEFNVFPFSAPAAMCSITKHRVTPDSEARLAYNGQS